MPGMKRADERVEYILSNTPKARKFLNAVERGDAKLTRTLLMTNGRGADALTFRKADGTERETLLMVAALNGHI